VVINPTTAAVTISQLLTGSYGTALSFTGSNSATVSDHRLSSNSSNSIDVNGANVTLGVTTTTSNRTGGATGQVYTLTSGTLNLTTTTSIANVKFSGANVSAPTFNINGGTLNNTSGSALTLGGLATATQNNRPAISLGGDFAFGTNDSTSANDLNLGISPVTLSANRVITVNGSTNLTMNAAISGAQTLTKAGSGTLTLGGNNPRTGATIISGGTLAISSTGQLVTNTAGSVTVNSGGTLSVYAWQYGLNGSIGTPFFNNASNSPSQLTVNGGTITYTGVGENSGTNNSRTFAIGTGGATLNAAGSGTWFITRHGTPASAVDQTTINGLTLTGSGNGQYSNVLAGSGGSLTKTGSGTWTLAGVNTYTGTTTVNQGTLTLSVDNALSNSSNLVIGAGTLSAGANVDDIVGTLDVTGIANINLGSAATLAFANSAAVDWTGGTLNVDGTLGATSLRFGTDNTGLTPAQLAVISVNGSGLGTYVLDASGYLVLGSGDATPPTLTSITDNVGGGPINIGDMVTYTVTFSEDMDASTVNATDFGNNGSAVASIGAVTETITPGVFTVPVTVTSPGTLVLRINALAVLEDVVGNDLDTDPALLDDTTITVRNAYQTWALTNAISSAPGADKDGDGVNNAIEFLLGGDVSTNDLSKLPEVTTTATDMIFTFERKRSSIDGITGLEIEVGTTLTGWPTSYTVGTTTANSDSGVTVAENSPVGFDTITLTVPIGSDPKKFARLNATVTE
jgi:autotransporter-associated beta strand protein